MSQRHLPLRRALAVSIAGLLSVGVLAVSGGNSTAATSVSGPDWTVTPVAGGFQVTLELAEPLPIVSDAPTLTVDGVDLGIATESADGLSLSVTTTDASVADATDVEQTWASGDEAKAEASDSPVTSTKPRIQPRTNVSKQQLDAEVARADGSAAGTYQYRQDDYDYGDQAIDMAGIGGIRGELTGRVYLPTTGGARPTVILLHGRHASCASTLAPAPAPSNPNRWPCVTGQTEVPSYKGYDGTAQTLASQGYAVVSISANAINANDAQLTADNGAQARGQLVLDSLTMIGKWNSGDPATYNDAAKGTNFSINDALDAPQADVGTTDLNQLDASTLVGRFDLGNVGLMGHSRGGEGVTAAVNLNQARPQPYGIKSVLPLAPVDFTRMTVSDTPMLVMLPYCDGDVSNQQGQHFSDDSRYGFDDSVLRSTVYVMGANHNFFNTVWTPGLYPYATGDDWAARTDSVCGADATTNIRLSAPNQYNVGTEYMAAWFRLTLGTEAGFLPLFDGSIKPTLTATPSADIRVMATAPSAERADIARFTELGATRVFGSATAAICASAGLRTLPQELTPCATANTVRGTGAMPHWTPATFAPNVPATPVMKFLWTSNSGTTAGSLRTPVPAAMRNASAYTALTFKTAPDESVTSGTDMTVSVVDGVGATWSSPVSALNPLAVSRMPASGSTTLNKIVLQQVTIPVTSMTGINTGDIREVRFTAGNGADNTATGGVYLSDLALSRSSIGTSVVRSSAPTVNVDSTAVEEGSGPDSKSVAVYLNQPSTRTTSAWLTLIGSTATTSKAGLAAERVVFAPGQTCKVVSVPTSGDSTRSTTASTAFKTGISLNANVIHGANAFGTLTVREDDGTVAPAPTTAVPNPVAPAPAAEVGVQGDPCAELAARSQELRLQASNSTPAPGALVTLTGTGFRSGESVTFTDSSTSPATTVARVLADANGTATAQLAVPAGATLGARPITALGAGSLRKETVTLTVQQPTSATAPTPAPTTGPVVPGTAAAPTTLRVNALRVVRKGGRSTVKLTYAVASTSVVVPTGTVRVKLGKVSKTVRLTASGIVKVTLKTRGELPRKVKASYSGDATHLADVDTTKTR